MVFTVYYFVFCGSVLGCITVPKVRVFLHLGSQQWSPFLSTRGPRLAVTTVTDTDINQSAFVPSTAMGKRSVDWLLGRREGGLC